MPYRKKIAEMDRLLESMQAEISRRRALKQKPGAGDPDVALEKLLASLARLKAERLRLMTRQRLI